MNRRRRKELVIALGILVGFVILMAIVSRMG